MKEVPPISMEDMTYVNLMALRKVKSRMGKGMVHLTEKKSTGQENDEKQEEKRKL